MVALPRGGQDSKKSSGNETRTRGGQGVATPICTTVTSALTQYSKEGKGWGCFAFFCILPFDSTGNQPMTVDCTHFVL